MPSSDFISVYDASQILGCSCRSVRRLVERELLQGVPLPGGRKLWLSRTQVEAVRAGMQRTARARREQGREAREALLQMWLDL